MYHTTTQTTAQSFYRKPQSFAFQQKRGNPALVSKVSKKRDAPHTDSTKNDRQATEFCLIKGAGPVIKTSTPQPSSSNISFESTSVKTFSIFDKKTPPSSASTTTATKKDSTRGATFPAQYRDILKRKKNVNLYIRNGMIHWQFAYNTLAIAAIKAHLPGRQYDPGLKEWSCPIETLPTAIALYKHMGRTPDASLVSRSKAIVRSCAGADPKDVITLTVRLDQCEQSSSNNNNNSNSEQQNKTIGTVGVKFLYNADIVSAIKCLPPGQRSFDPATKVWSISLMALPELLLVHLEPLGFHAASNEALLQLCTSCQVISNIIFDDDLPPPEGAESQSPISVTNQSQVNTTSTVTEGESNALKRDNLKKELHNVVQLLKCVDSKMKKSGGIDRSNCGAPKKRAKLSRAQIRWSLKKRGLWSSDDEDNFFAGNGDSDDDVDTYDNEKYDDNHFNSNMYGFDPATWSANLLSTPSRKTSSGTAATTSSMGVPPTSICDCGNPQKRSGGFGEHVCRYYGTFSCGGCGNNWTSAYTWKGEKQACRSCNKESFPSKKEQLKGGLGRTGGGHHDSSRCSRCRRLGYDCSSSGYMN